jgi:hypothetical protein
MARRKATITLEVGDKVIPFIGATEEYGEQELTGDEVLTIATIEDIWTLEGEVRIFTFEEIEGYWSWQHFLPHSSTLANLVDETINDIGDQGEIGREGSDADLDKIDLEAAYARYTKMYGNEPPF